MRQRGAASAKALSRGLPCMFEHKGTEEEEEETSLRDNGGESEVQTDQMGCACHREALVSP